MPTLTSHNLLFFSGLQKRKSIYHICETFHIVPLQNKFSHSEIKICRRGNESNVNFLSWTGTKQAVFYGSIVSNINAISMGYIHALYYNAASSRLIMGFFSCLLLVFPAQYFLSCWHLSTFVCPISCDLLFSKGAPCI